MRTTYSFILHDCAKRLDLDLSSMVGSMVTFIPANGSTTTSLVCLNCLVAIYGKNFMTDLVFFIVEST